MARVSAATGLKFIDDGSSDEPPAPHRAAYQPDRYGRWRAPVLIPWTDPVEVPALDGTTVGLGGSTSLVTRGPLSTKSTAVYVTGMVQLDGPALNEMRAPISSESERQTAVLVEAIILHELGHLVGLDHIDDVTQLMNLSTQHQAAYASGDLTGLAQLGHGECHPEV